MIEVELKASLTAEEAARMETAVLACGFLPTGAVRETDIYFNGTARDFRQTDEALRLRTVQSLPDGQPQTLVTYKGPKLDAVSASRMEYETAVADAAVMQKLFAALGFAPLYTVRKTRRSFTCGARTVCLDTVDSLGDFMELESLLPDGSDRAAATGELLSLLDALGVARTALTRKSYLELLIASATE